MKAIKAEPIEIRKLFEANEFIIPEFQRPYTWDIDNCDKLWEDIENFIDSCIEENNKNDRYFLGSIVVYKEDQNKDVWSVVDGQQRLTTLFLLIKALYDSNVTYSALKNVIYKRDKKTGQASLDDLRLQSKVQTEDSSDFEAIMKQGKPSKEGSKSSFNLNYEQLNSHFNKWLGTNYSDCDNFIESFLDQIVLLPIECDSEEDALNLFQIINDRGAPLSDADIFKAKIYKAAGQEGKPFIKRWENLGNDIDGLFRNFMHVSRAEKKDISKEIGLRKYMEKHHMGREHQLGSHWDSIVCNLENTYKIYNQEKMCSGDKQSDYDWVYWQILLQYPNTYCQYPPIVFLHKYGKRNDDNEFCVSDEKQDEYIALLENTVRYFFIKGIVHNAANAVKDTTYKVCRAIYHGEDYINEYKEVVAKGKKDMGDFWRKLEISDCGKCRRGLVVLNSFLNIEQSHADYKKVLSEECNIEHILPKMWNNYYEWDEESHKNNIERIGNLMLLEKNLNIGVSNKEFRRKQIMYGRSKVQDALYLSQKEPNTWDLNDVDKRHKESMRRLQKFFEDFK